MLSDMYDVAKLREHCLDIIARNFEAFAEATELRALLLTLQPDAQANLFSDLRERWLRAAAPGLDRRDENATLFDQRLDMLILLATEQEANDGSNV
jgi:ankyrin repeat/BTB/POZ domain-containing protein 1